MICGVGVDLVELAAFRRQIGRMKEGALRRLFTDAEREAAAKKGDPVAYLATRFAAKEAIYKAVRPRLGAPLDLRKLETRSRRDGSPCFCPSDALRLRLKEAGIGAVHLSITDEKDYAVAFAVAEGEEDGRFSTL